MRWAWTGLGLLAVFLATWVQVPATNFSGWDEWLVVNLTSRGILNLPYENRPLSLLFNLPGALFLPFTLAGFWLVHAGYVVLAGALTSWLVQRLGVEDGRVAFMAGAFAVSFAPLDAMRLDAVLLANYSGAAFAVVLVLALLVEAERRADDKLALLAALLGFMAIRSLESSAALLAAAPLLPLMAMPAKAGRLRRALLYALVVGVGLALAVRPLLPGQAASYQVSGLGFDPHPGRLAGRMAQLLALHLTPLVHFVPAELGRVGVLVAVAAFLAVWSRLGMPAGGDDASAWRRPLLVGVGGAVLAQAVLALSPANVTPWRTQILSAPFVGMALAAGLGGLARWKPGRALCPLLGAWVVAIGASRVLAMQADWDRLSYWPRQSESLRQLAQAAPRFTPGTLVILLDESRAWPATFTFRHALEYLYEGEAAGVVWGGEAFLYPARFTPQGVLSEPYESIREAWRAPVALHGWEDLVAARLDVSGKLHIEGDWPARLPPLPEGAVYAPDRRIDRERPRPRAQRLLGFER